MKKYVLIAIGVIGGFILLSLSFSYGYFLGQKGIEETKLETSISNLLESKLVRDLRAVAEGEITKIVDRTLTLTSEGETLEIPIEEEAKIIAVVLKEAAEGKVISPESKEIEFKDIKIGDKVTVQINLNTDGEVEGVTVVIKNIPF